MFHLVLCDAFVLLQHLQQLLVLSVKLGDFLSVKLQQLPGGTQVSQPLMDRGKWGVRFSTRRTKVGSVETKKRLLHFAPCVTVPAALKKGMKKGI